MIIDANRIKFYNRAIRVVGDIHSNYDCLNRILNATPSKYFVIFLGDLFDFGDKPVQCLELVHDRIFKGRGIMLRGNHDRKMHRYAQSKILGSEFKGQITHGMQETLDCISCLDKKDQDKFYLDFCEVIDYSPDWIQIENYVFSHGSVVKGMIDNKAFRAPNRHLESAALYGETDGTINENGYPVRTYNWVDKLPAGYNAVVGHQIMSVDAPVVKHTPNGNKVYFLDTGSSKDGKLSYMDLGFDVIPFDNDKTVISLEAEGFGFSDAGLDMVRSMDSKYL